MKRRFDSLFEIPEDQKNDSIIISNSSDPHQRSIVRVKFPYKPNNPYKGIELSYYNDQFDLQCGDWVYVDGKLEGILGRVIDVTHNFKIKASDYQRVVALVDTDVHGKFYMAGSHFVAFDRGALDYEQVIRWFKAPDEEDDGYIIEKGDDQGFSLKNLSEMNVSTEVAKRGYDYYCQNKVHYLSVDDGCGRAIVEGSKPYEVEFEYQDGKIRHLICTCFCTHPCKHEVAAMIQLQEALELISKQYASEYERGNYFSAVNKNTFITFSVKSKERGCLIL